MAEFFLNRMLFARLRATRTATGAKPVPRYQPDTQSEASHGDEKEDATTQATEDPEDEVDDGAEDEIDEGAERVPAAEDARGNADLLQIPSADSNLRMTWTTGINTVWRCTVDNATLSIAQARDAAVDVVEKLKELGFIGTVKAIGQWMRLNPWKTVLVVGPLVALACTAITLSATGFGPAGIVAAAGIHAGIGSVAAGSIFATCTSAMMGGYGAPIIFGGVWAISTGLVVLIAAMRKRWKSRHERALIVQNLATPKSEFEIAKHAASDVVFWSTVAAAYVVYRFKSWYRGRGEGIEEVDD